MKLMLGGTPVKKMMIHNDTMDATMVASDLQAGVTAYANGRKVTGTGKSFSFASYGMAFTNDILPVPNVINVIEIACLNYPIKLSVALNEMRNIDFAVENHIADVIIDGKTYPITVCVSNNILNITCDHTISLEVFFGKDEYV